MASVNLSEAERTFTIHGVQDNVREDGRARDDYRHVQMETGVLSNAHGSCKLALGNTQVLVGVKADLAAPEQDPNKGELKFFVDFSANAAPAFEGRGGEELALHISSTLHKAYEGCIDLKSLCLIPRLSCWVIHADVMLLQCGGNLLDAVSMAVKAALYNTQLPRITVVTSEQGLQEVEISDDPYDTEGLDVSNTPLIVTVSKLGHSHLVDATQNEEACALARLHVAVTNAGEVTHSRLGGGGSLHPDSVGEMFECARRVAMSLNSALQQTLQHEAKTKVKPIGFLK